MSFPKRAPWFLASASISAVANCAQVGTLGSKASASSTSESLAAPIRCRRSHRPEDRIMLLAHTLDGPPASNATTS
jgi:hypothetical protein